MPAGGSDAAARLDARAGGTGRQPGWWRLRAWLAGLPGTAARNQLFCVTLVLAAAGRVIVMAGYQPAVLIRLDSYIYLLDSTRATLDPDNPDGYPFLLWLLRPFHSLSVIAGVQHVMGLAIGILVYAIARRYGVPRWAATLAALPVLLDPREVFVEHAIMADTLATLLILAAFAVLLWPVRQASGPPVAPGPPGRPAPSAGRAVAGGLLLGASSLVRPTGLVLILLAAGYLLVARAGWRRAAAGLAAGLLPVAAYAAWFFTAYGAIGLTNSNGLFLWSRTMSFADCAVIRPPPDLRALCPGRNPGQPHRLKPDPLSWHTLLKQESPQDYLWSRQDWMWQPRPAGYQPYEFAFTSAKNARAQRFAIRAIAAQPAGYARVVAEGIALTFVSTDHQWKFPGQQPMSPRSTAGTYQFELRSLRSYTGTDAGLARYLGFFTGIRRQQPAADWVLPYQKWVYLPGGVFAAVFAAGLAGILIRRRGSAAAVLAWVSALAGLVLPIALHQFNYRYALGVVPLAFLAAAVAIGRRVPA